MGQIGDGAFLVSSFTFTDCPNVSSSKLTYAEQDQSKRVIEPRNVQHFEHAHVEERRTHDPDWVMDLDLNSDSDDD